MRNMCELATEKDRPRDGTPSTGDLQPRPEVGIPSPAVNVPKAPGGKRGGGTGAAKVARKKRKPQLNHVLMAMLVDELMDGGSRPQELADVTGLRLQTVNRVLKAFHKRGVIHICGWEKDANGRTAIRVFAFGRRKDAAKPVSRRSDINRAYRQRKRVNAARALYAANDEQGRDVA